MQVESHSIQQNLYEIPHCTICLNQMNQDMANLACGHVFHLPCITQHFQYRGTCPNCQKRSLQKEIRTVLFPLQKNTQSAQFMRQVLGNLSLQEKQQIQVLFKEVQILTQKNEKLENRNAQAQKEAKKAIAEVNQVKMNFNRTKLQLETVKKDSVQIRKVVDHLNLEIKNLKQENFDNRQKILQYKEREADYDQVKKYKKIMHDNAQELINYKSQLEKKNTNPAQMAKQFFDMILIKNLEVFNLKNKIQSFPQKIMEKDEQIRRLESQLQRARKEAKEAKEKVTIEKKKYDDLKQKYKKLHQKYRTKCQEHSEEENYEDSMLSRPSFPLGPQASNNRIHNSGNVILSFEMNENSELNIQMGENRLGKKASENKLSFRIEEQKAVEVSRNQEENKGGIQMSMDGFVNKKSLQVPFTSFGGVKPKKNAEEMKKTVAFKNLFG